MAWPNIDERRNKVREMMTSGIPDREIKRLCSDEFGCSPSAIDSDLRLYRGTQYYYRRSQEIAEQCDYICQYCGIREPRGVLEHVVSKSMGGHDEPYNLTYACWSCNTLKKLKVWVPVNIDTITKDNPDWRDKILTMATTSGRKCSFLEAEKRIIRHHKAKSK